MVARRPGEVLPGVDTPAIDPTRDDTEWAFRRQGYVPRVTTLPTAIAKYTGRHLMLIGGAGVADRLYCALKAAGGTYSWVLIATG